MKHARGSDVVHASTVAFGRRAVLIMGAAGAGKSCLALDLMSRGAVLVSDDRTILTCHEGVLTAAPHPALRGRIEARGVGLLAVEITSPVAVSLAVDLDRAEPHRLPPTRSITLLDRQIDLIYGKGNPCLAGAILALLKGARVA